MSGGWMSCEIVYVKDLNSINILWKKRNGLLPSTADGTVGTTLLNGSFRPAGLTCFPGFWCLPTPSHIDHMSQHFCDHLIVCIKALFLDTWYHESGRTGTGKSCGQAVGLTSKPKMAVCNLGTTATYLSVVVTLQSDETSWKSWINPQRCVFSPSLSFWYVSWKHATGLACYLQLNILLWGMFDLKHASRWANLYTLLH